MATLGARSAPVTQPSSVAAPSVGAADSLDATWPGRASGAETVSGGQGHSPRRARRPVRGSRRDLGLPRWLILVAALALASIAVPIIALAGGADWAAFPAALASPEARSALGLSLATSAITCVLCVLLGVPLALVLARARSRWMGPIRAIVALPLVLPPMVGGIALLSLFGRRGPLGAFLEAAFDIRVPFTTVAVIIAQTFVALPFLVVSVEGALQGLGDGHERVAASLGAGRSRVLRTITLPLVAPALLNGTVLCFARALGEFGATALFAGNVPGVTRTMPLAIYTAFNGVGVSQQTATALALVLVLTAAIIMTVAGLWRGRSTS